jgi:hypothetical protein
LLVGEDGASSFPKEWAKSGRFSLPRLVFVFQRNPIRQDLALDKKVNISKVRLFYFFFFQKEMLENMEKHLENQISILLKKNNIIDCGHNAFGTITINTGQPFVYIFSHKEAPIDVNLIRFIRVPIQLIRITYRWPKNS